jgi:hypothetical protein
MHRQVKLIFAVLTAVSLITLAALGIHSAYAQTDEQLGVEIQTNTAAEAIYLPVALPTQKNRLYALVPVANGGETTAVRIVPVMDRGRVRFEVYAVSGDLSKAQSCADRLLLPSKLLTTRSAGKGRAVTVSGEGWSVEVRVVQKRAEPTASSKKLGQSALTFAKTVAQIAPVAGDCGCASCTGGIRCCPNKGDCMQCPCGMVCCTGGSGN